MTREASDSKGLRTIIIVLLVLELAVLAWLMFDRARHGGATNPDLNLLVVIGACGNLLLATPLLLSKTYPELRRGLVILAVASALVSIVSLTLVDYSALKKSNLLLVAIFLVPVVGGRLRKRG